MIRVYIACPYTIGDIAINVRNAMDAADEVMELGLYPFNPLLFHFQHMHRPRSYHEWMRQDLEWLRSCQIVWRLPGVSSGADQEEKFAAEHGIPVIKSLDELKTFIANLKVQLGDMPTQRLGE